MNDARNAAVLDLLTQKEAAYHRKGWDTISLQMYTVWPTLDVFSRETAKYRLQHSPLPAEITRSGAGVSRRFNVFAETMGKQWSGLGLGRLPSPHGFALFSEGWGVDKHLREPGKRIADHIGAWETRNALCVLKDGTVVQLMRRRGEKPIAAEASHVRDHQVGLVGALWTLIHGMGINTDNTAPNFGWSSYTGTEPSAP